MDVRTLCLGMLAFGDASGYEIKKELEQGPSRHFLDASFGSIYPALTRLTDEGLVECRTESQEKRPDKKVYSLTEAGFDALDGRLHGPVAQDKFRSDFLFVMLFADRLPRDLVAARIDAQIANWRDSLKEMDESEAPNDGAGVAFARRYAKAIGTANIDFLERNRHLIETAARGDIVSRGQQAETTS